MAFTSSELHDLHSLQSHGSGQSPAPRGKSLWSAGLRLPVGDDGSGPAEEAGGPEGGTQKGEE